jgi:glycerophosphoryl diester phosphodiesterase
MKQQIITLICFFQILIVFGQSPFFIEHQPFDNVIEIDSSLLIKREVVTLVPVYTNYANKKDLIYFFNDKFGKSKNSKKGISWKTKVRKDLKSILLDTAGNCSVKLRFNRGNTLQEKRGVINELKLDLKRTLMLWQERVVDGSEVYFVGHRGGLMSHFQENTNDIFKYSKQEGVSFMEIDVVISKDKVPFVGHDWKYLSSKLKIRKSSDSLAVSKARFPDGQGITFMSKLFAEHQFLILDLIHNSVTEQKEIIKYLHMNFPKEISTHTYIQVDKFPMYYFIKKLDSKILVSYNLRGANTGRWRSQWLRQVKQNIDNIEMYVVNPSNVINEKFLKKFGSYSNRIVPVIQKDNLKELRRMTKLGFKFMMIDDAIYVDHKLKEAKVKKK